MAHSTAVNKASRTGTISSGIHIVYSTPRHAEMNLATAGSNAYLNPARRNKATRTAPGIAHRSATDSGTPGNSSLLILACTAIAAPLLWVGHALLQWAHTR